MTTGTTGVIQYGLGNAASVENMLRKIGAPARMVSTPDELRAVDRLILPGVGSFDRGMTRLRASGLLDALTRRVMDDRIPILGICLGMQLMGEGSEEGNERGLGWLPMTARRFSPSPELRLPVPHMGWNHAQARAGMPLFAGFTETPRFYFVHSFFVAPSDDAIVAATADYGGSFTAAVARDNIFGVQFHPEKSHRFGMQLLRNFALGAG
jgi:imidazole glycerol-phosphate synthase subunit HisH